jgi:hypothetical protein
METKVNYTEEQTQALVAGYKAGETVEALAEVLGKSVRSVVAKLVREGVYITRTREVAPRITKARLIGVIAGTLNLDPVVLAGLEKAPLEVLETLLAAVEGQK